VKKARCQIKDKGPARRFVRNYVDERKSVTEYFLIFIMFILFLTVIPSPAVQLGAILLMYSAMIWVAIDGFLLSRRVKKLVAEKFPGEFHKRLRSLRLDAIYSIKTFKSASSSSWTW